MPSGIVKWYNASKGFGFVQPDDGGPDVFVHVSAVEQAGLNGLDEGATVNFELERDRRSGKTSAGSLVVTGAGNPAPRAPRSDGPPRRPPMGGGGGGGYSSGGGGGGGGASGGPGQGTVKWFNPTKGFGFIQPENGGSDVFVHISAVEQAGLSGLNEGAVVAYELESDRRSGKESAVALRVISEGSPGGGGGGGGGFGGGGGGGGARPPRPRW